MTCDAIRAALSALLDGEAAGTGAAELEAHLAGCPGCRDWHARAERVTQAVRLHPAEVPDLTATVFAAVAADRQAAADRVAVAGSQRRQMLRVAVGLVALAQVVLAIQPMLGWLAAPHSSREMSSFELAFAVGFGLAAYRPQLAHAFVPAAVVLAACLGAVSVIDTANASTALVHEVGHLAAVGQAVLLWALGRTWRRASAPGMAAAGPAARA